MDTQTNAQSNPVNVNKGFNWGDFFSFRKMITLQIIQIVYVIVAVFITIGSLIMIFSGGGGNEYGYYNRGMFAGGPLMGFLFLIFGNIAWRMWCELIIVFFRINNTLSNIEENTKK